MDGKRVRIYLAEQDKAEHSRQPLWEALLKLLHDQGAAGATVFRGLAGFGPRNRMHFARLADIVPDLPLVVEWVDDASRVHRLLPAIRGLVKRGTITLEAVELVPSLASEDEPRPESESDDTPT